ISVSSNPPARFDNQQLRQQFDLNKFQHAVIEHLEKLRAKAGLTTSKPLRLGLADGWSDSREEELKFDFKYLQVMDQLSLGICCTIPPHATSFAFFERPGGETVQLEIQRPDPGTLKVAPWPFDREKIVVEYGYKSVPARPFSNPQEWTEVYSAAPSLSQRVEVVPI
ncbi:MAG TPA: DUF3891 family protein, partial [Tepidisphaeraceae bacterium]